MSNYEKKETFVDVYFDVTLEERIRRFLEQFSPTYKGYILDQTPNQINTQEVTIRIYYDNHSSLILTCYSPEMLQLRIQNIFKFNKKVRFINSNPGIEKNTFGLTQPDGMEDITVYYTATLDFDFINS